MALTPKPPECSGCPRANQGVGFVRPLGPPEAKYIILGQGPDMDAAQQSRSFFEKSYIGEMTMNRLYRAGLQRSDCIFTDIVWCSARDAYSPFKAPVEPEVGAIKHCWKNHLGPYLHSLPETDTPRHLITLGAPPVRWIKGLTQKQPVEAYWGTTLLEEIPA